MHNYLEPLKGKPRRKKIVAFDTEGDGSPFGFILGSVVSDQERCVFYDRVEMLKYLTSSRFRNHYLVAHNLEYDLSVMTGGDFTWLTVIFAGSRLLWAETTDDHGHKWRFVDSGNIFRSATVEALGQMVSLPKLRLPAGVLASLSKGQLWEKFSSQEQKQIIRYNLRDSEIVFKAISELQEELLSLGGQLRETAASIAMDLFRRKFLDLPFPRLDPELNALARSGYHGARTEPYIFGRTEKANGYDINSLYPAMQAQSSYPHPGQMIFKDHITRHSMPLEYEGLMCAKVYVPEDQLPILPVKTGGRLFFSTGTYVGVWSHTELRYALANGVKLLEPYWSLFSPITFNPFVSFIETLYDLKVACASDNPIRRELYKLLMNSLYGRFGLNPDNGLEVLQPILEQEDFDHHPDSRFRMIGHFPYLLTTIQNENVPAYCNTLIAGQITSAGRVHMHRLLAQKADELIYMDTDGVFTSGDFKTSDELGGIRQTHEDVDLWVVGAKEYALFRGEEVIEARAKGIPASHRYDYLHFGEISFKSPLSIREAYQKGGDPGIWIKRLKSRRIKIPKRCPLGEADDPMARIQTRPWRYFEVQDLD